MKTKINDGWYFVKLPLGSTLEDAMKSAFRPVDLPHDWLIWQAENLYESADAWYYRDLHWVGKEEEEVLLSFDGVYMDAEILLNGEEVGHRPYGYAPFFVSLTGRLRTGPNRLMVHIRHQSPNSRWYSGSGIFRDVNLLVLPKNHLVPYGLSLRTDPAEDGSWMVTLSVETAGEAGIGFTCEMMDPDGVMAASSSGTGETQGFTTALRIPNGRPWSPESPELYTLKICFGEQTEVCKIGLRTFSMDPDLGFFLNGRHLKLRGVCLHHDLGALGAAFHEKAARRQLQLMQRMGVNAIRTSHNPPAEKFLDLCDEMGFLVIDEAFDMWKRSKTPWDYARFFESWAAKDIAAMVRRDRRHACVIMWSVGNEIYDMHADPEGPKITRFLAEQVRRNDPEVHGATTFGCNYMPWEGGQRCAEEVEAVGYNYGEKVYNEHHRLHPRWIIYGSETGSILSSRGIYHFPMKQSIMSEADQQCSALGNSNTSWGASDLKDMIVEDLQNPFSLGQFVWSGIDYIGEPTPYHTRSCYFGQADTACYPKDSWFLIRSLWTDVRMVHIGVTWDWNSGQMIDVPVMSGCREVELFLNGRTLGRKVCDRSCAETCLPVWKVPFEKGVLLAKGYDASGNLLCEDRRETSGETAELCLTPEEDVLLGDGWDLAFVTVTARDAEGRPVENARDEVTVSVSGGGCLMGTDNGDSTDPEGYKASRRRLFSGKLLLIIGSTGEREDVRVVVRGVGDLRAVLTIPVREAQRIQGVSRLQRIPEDHLPVHRQVRRVNLTAESDRLLTKDHPDCLFRYALFPADAEPGFLRFQVTNAAGIESPFVSLSVSGDQIKVHAIGDGQYYLRALWGEQEGNCQMISQLEFVAQGLGKPFLDPYTYLSAGLYDLSTGEIGTGNEKGIAFDRTGESMVGFSGIDFGRAGSDRLTVDLFALNGDPYELDLFDGVPGNGGRLLKTLHYEKPSIWNVYQPETWQLPERLTGIHTLCFRVREKIHMKGFRFEKQSRVFRRHMAGEADSLYGDSFRREGDRVLEIGNNVSLFWEEMDFGQRREVILALEGKTPLAVNAVTIRFRNAQGEERTEIANFRGDGGDCQLFRLQVPGGVCSVTFIFLPGSRFDFEAFTFLELETGQNGSGRV